VFHDVVVHPSGEVTLALEHTDRAADGYALRRLRADGALIDESTLTVGELLPEVDRVGLPNPPWRMRAPALGALEGGWILLAADGEDLVVVFQSLINSATSNGLVSGVSWLARTETGTSGFSETRTRLVDGEHFVMPPVWNYDEFRWIDALVRPQLAVDPHDGTVIVGRAFTSGRCRANMRMFGEFALVDCFERATGNTESRTIPYLYTSFAADGTRLGSHGFIPERGYYYGVFAIAASHGALALVGAVAEENAGGELDLYAATPGAPAIMVPFDALIAVLDRDSGAVREDHRIDRGRAESLLAVRYVGDELLAVGATDWDRHNGGMSVSRGSDPLVVHVSADGAVSHRAFDAESPDRHALFYDAHFDGTALRLVGVIDAPMTHSGDGDRTEEMTFGALEVLLE
jgi:hypothetical protein